MKSSKIFAIFKDKNDYNEKTIIGALSFMIMSGIAITDTVVAILGRTLPINEYIYNSFVIITLGAFGIAEVGKVAKIFKHKDGGVSMEDIADDAADAADAAEAIEQKEM